MCHDGCWGLVRDEMGIANRGCMSFSRKYCTYADAMQVVNSYMPSELKTIMLSDKFAVLPWMPW